MPSAKPLQRGAVGGVDLALSAPKGGSFTQSKFRSDIEYI